jgi:hypothetical protein
MIDRDIRMQRGRLYGLLVDEDDVPTPTTPMIGEVLWGVEFFGDGHSGDKPMCEIIITAANHSCDPPCGEYPGGLKSDGYHFTWDGPKPFEEPRVQIR